MCQKCDISVVKQLLCSLTSSFAPALDYSYIFMMVSLINSLRGVKSRKINGMILIKLHQITQ